MSDYPQTIRTYLNQLSEYNPEDFIFGSKIFDVPDDDTLSSLPLELSWMIFMYLDGVSLRNANSAFEGWSKIIKAHTTLKQRLDQSEPFLVFGSNWAKFFNKRKGKLRKNTRKNCMVVRPAEGSKVRVMYRTYPQTKTQRAYYTISIEHDDCPDIPFVG